MAGNGHPGIPGFSTNYQGNIMGQHIDGHELDIYDYENKNRLFGNVHLRTTGNLHVNVYGNLTKNTTSVEGNIHMVNTDKIMTINGITNSTSHTNGALVVVGGAGIGGNVNIGSGEALDATNQNNTALNVSGGARVSDRLYVGSNDEATSATAAALVVNGGAAIGRDLWVAGNLMVQGSRTEVNVNSVQAEDPLITLHKSSNNDDSNNTLSHLQTAGAGLEFYAHDYTQNGNVVGYLKTGNNGKDLTFKSVNENFNGVVSVQPHASLDSYVLMSNTRDNTIQRIFNSNLQIDNKLALGGAVATTGNTLDVKGDVGFQNNLVVNANIDSSTGNIRYHKVDLGTDASRIAHTDSGSLVVNGFCGTMYLKGFTVENTGEIINFTVTNNKISSDRLVFLNLLNFDGTSFAPHVYCTGSNNGSFDVQYSTPFAVTNGNLTLKYLIA